MKKGMPSINPDGRPKSKFQDYAVRADILIDKHGREGILRIAKSEKLLNEEPGIDPIVIQALANIFNGKKDPIFSALERERMLDRTVGGIKRTVLHGGAKDTVPIPIQTFPGTAEEAAEMYRNAQQGLIITGVEETETKHDETEEDET